MHTTRTATRALAVAAAAAAVVTLGVTLPGAAAAADPVLPPPAADIFPNVGTADFDVQHYDVDMQYRANDDISAVTTVTAVAAKALDTIRLDLEGLTVDAVTVNGRNAAFTREADFPATRHKLVVTPLAPVTGEFTVAVTYHGAPTRHQDPDGSFEGWMPTGTGVAALGQPVGTMTWLPSNNTVGDKATYDIDVTAPTRTDGQDLSVASSGNLVSQTVVDADRTRWSWAIGTPLSTSMLVLSVGHFDLLTSTITLASGRVLPEWSFVAKSASDGDRAYINSHRALIKPMLDWLETKLGPYPGESTGIIWDRAGVGYALETQDRPFFDGFLSDKVLLHELAHMWLGNSVSPDTWSEIWVSEGAARFFEAYYGWQVLGEGDPRQIAADAVKNEPADAWKNPSVGWTDPAQLYGWQAYTRGSFVYSALMNALGPDGFDEVMKSWTKTYRTSSVVTGDFITVASAASGRDLSRTLNQWIVGATAPLLPEDIVRIEPSDTVTTTQGTAPVLPRSVTPVYKSGAGTASPVIWNTAAQDWSKPGQVTVTGTGADFFGAPFTTASVKVNVLAAPVPTPTVTPTPTVMPLPTVGPSPTGTPSSGSTPLPTVQGASQLSATGSAPVLPALAAGLVLLVAGASAFVISRRRRHAD